MSAFYTPDAMATIWATELELEQEQLMLDKIDQFDPYLDEDDEGEYWIAEDAGMEGYLFGWDS